ncbi:MAG: DUF4974 domain-containing protein [Prolixibacteraceae bacterium]|nr:DUF4974 domain-containing protein [Prolixibacteraceae bacterium]
MQDSKIYKTLKNYLNGNYTYNDLVSIKHWLNNLENFPEARQFLSEDWQEILNRTDHGEKSLQHIYENIEYQILLEEKSQPKKKSIWNVYRQVAAVLLIPVIIFAFFNHFKHAGEDAGTDWVQIHSPAGARTEFMLPDGSRGWLNSRSTLKYQPQFIKSRRVELAGEAYFEINPGNSLFVVGVNGIDINVLGTKFNVSAYPGEQFTEIVLDRGQVKIRGTAHTFEKVLIPGNKLAYENENGKFLVRDVDTRLYSAWKEGFLMMDNEMFSQAVNRLERWYNVDIVIEDDVLKNYRFKATFKDEPLEEILRLISLTTPIDYKIEDRVPGTDGLYQKKRVIIKLKS